MSTKPRSYDDITRATVPDPDSGFRPTKEQVTDAYTGDHTRGADELKLYADVQGALHAHDDGHNVAIEIRNDAVELRGSVTNGASLDQLEELVRKVPGVGSVSNKLIIAH